MEERIEEREEAGCNLTARFDTVTKKLCERDRWTKTTILVG